MSTSRSSSVKSSHASSSLSSSSSSCPSSRPPPSSTPSSPLSSSSYSILSRFGGSSSPLSSVVLSLVSAASITAVEVNGRRRALAESCSVWLKHRMRLTSSNVFASRCSTVVCLSFEVALSPTKVKIYSQMSNKITSGLTICHLLCLLNCVQPTSYGRLELKPLQCVTKAKKMSKLPLKLNECYTPQVPRRCPRERSGHDLHDEDERSRQQMRDDLATSMRR